jgi:FkbM family methyltransferase
MINFEGVSDRRFIGRLLRFPLRWIPSGTVLPVLQGRMRGKKWIVGSGNHGYWLGSYEYEKQTLFCSLISKGAVVYDVGAHVGFYTLLSSVLVGPKGKVFAYEPLPRNVRYLNEHIRLNKCRNITVYEVAVSDKSGHEFFEYKTSNFQGMLCENGHFQVRTVCLDRLVLDGIIPPPGYVKIDVEGAENKVLQGAAATLSRYHPVIFLSTHGNSIHQKSINFLESLGYELKTIDNRKGIVEADEIVAT